MKLTVAGRNLEITDAIKKHLNSRLDKITTSLSEGADIHVSLHVNKYRHTADVTVKQKGFTIHADEETKEIIKEPTNILFQEGKKEFKLWLDQCGKGLL